MASKPLNVSNRELMAIQRGLAALDGHACKDGPLRYDFDASLVWNAAKAKTIVDRHVATFEHAKKTLAAQQQIVDGQKLSDENAPRVAKFLEQVSALEAKEVELTGVFLLSRKELQKGGLNLPNVFAQLMPIIEDK